MKLAHRRFSGKLCVSKNEFKGIINDLESSYALVCHLWLQLIINGPSVFQPLSGCGHCVLHSDESLHLPEENHSFDFKHAA